MGCCDHKPYGGAKPTIFRLLAALLAVPVLIGLFVLSAYAGPDKTTSLLLTQPVVDFNPVINTVINERSRHHAPFLSCDQDDDDPLNDSMVTQSGQTQPHWQPLLGAPEPDASPIQTDWHSIPYFTKR